jgi:hypothetical protein
MKFEKYSEEISRTVFGDRSIEASETWNGIGINRRTVLRGVAAAGALGTGLLTVGAAPGGAATSGGPVVLMGIDADDSGHGADSIFAGVVADILSNVTNSGSGLLVIGANGSPSTGFWSNMGSLNSVPVTIVTGAANIGTQDFSGFAMIGVAGSAPETPGGMTQAENDALVGQAADLADFVNNGGGLFGLSQTNFTNAWDYLGSIGAFTTIEGLFYDDVTATSEGNAIGITDTNLDVCCWHDVFTAFPPFLNVLATNNQGGTEQGEAAALGGASVVIQVCPEEEVALIAGQDEEVGTVTILEDEDDISVTYTLNEGWYMTESHLHLAENCEDIPQTGSGNPKVGQFEYGMPYDPPVQADTIVVDQKSGWDAEDTLCVAAHAAVFKDMNGNGLYDPDVDREETAWGEGDRFTERGNWAMYFEYEVCD